MRWAGVHQGKRGQDIPSETSPGLKRKKCAVLAPQSYRSAITDTLCMLVILHGFPCYGACQNTQWLPALRGSQVGGTPSTMMATMPAVCVRSFRMSCSAWQTKRPSDLWTAEAPRICARRVPITLTDRRATGPRAARARDHEPWRRALVRWPARTHGPGLLSM